MSFGPEHTVQPVEEAEPGWFRVPGWAFAIALVVLTGVVGPSLGGLMRPIFILCCAAVGYYSWQQSASIHLQTSLILFAFSAFLRRMVDVSAGFDPSGIMLVGPLLALLVPAPILLVAFQGRPFANQQIYPLLSIAGCVIYAAILTIAQGDFMGTISSSLKLFAPLIYAACLMMDGEEPEKLMQAAASIFLFIVPVLGIYGIYQYIDPPEWDRYWMKSATILSAGQPLPYLVRTFSMLNSPGSFAAFIGVGLFLVLFLRNGLISMLLIMPAAVSFLLSMYRTAWIGFAAAIVFCLLFLPTRKRATWVIIVCIIAIIIALQTPFGDVISDRFATLGQGSEDGSARERLEQYATLWSKPDSGLFGTGFVTVDVGTAGSMAIDGLIVTCWINMGIVVGLICIASVLWLCLNAISGAWRRQELVPVVAGAIGLNFLLQIPLANILPGEIGFLFWAFIVMI